MEDEVKKRIDEFVRRYGELVNELHVDFANYPMYLPAEGGSFKTILQSVPVDTLNQPVKSPFVAQG